MKTNRWITVLLVPMLFVCGCGRGNYRIDYSNVDLAQVSGRITLDGQAVPYAQVFFHDVKMDTNTFGLTDAGGKYKLMFNTQKEGAEPGEKIVRIWTARGGAEFGDKIPKENLGRDKEKIPAAYNRSSELTAVIVSSKEKSRQTFDFDLDSTKVAATPATRPTRQPVFDEFEAE